MKPVLAITMGDPAGIGPEIVLKALARPRIGRICRPVVFGDAVWLRYAQKRALRGTPAGRVMFRPAGSGRGGPHLVDLQNVPASGVRFGEASAAAGRASGEYIAAAVSAMEKGDADALVTAPINKFSFEMGGWGRRYVGHTEMLAGLTGARHVALMLIHGRLRAIHVTSHVPLREVRRRLTRGGVVETIRLAHAGLIQLGYSRPKIAVCGLNPHAGDQGRIGDEEKILIAPAVAACRRSGIRVSGPLAADTLWPQVLAGAFDVGVAMYHDQGQIPVKLLAFRSGGKVTTARGVNVTIGLPIIRTSVAHGTAYEIAGRGIASEESLVDAIELACQMVARRRSRRQ